MRTHTHTGLAYQQSDTLVVSQPETLHLTGQRAAGQEQCWLASEDGHLGLYTTARASAPEGRSLHPRAKQQQTASRGLHGLTRGKLQDPKDTPETERERG